MKACWSWLRVNEKQLKLIFAVIAAGYVIFEYEMNKRDAEISRTLNFETRYSEKEVLKAHLELDSFLLNPDTKNKIDKAQDPGTEIMNLVRANGHEQDVLVLSDFFAELTTCVRNGICDLTTACAVFKDRVVAHRNNYYKLFELWQKLWGQNFIQDSYDYFTKSCK